jgi:hypothetical protein
LPNLENLSFFRLFKSIRSRCACRLPRYMQGKQTASFAEIVSDVRVALTLNSIDQ